MKHGGIFFFCGPADNNNLELKNFHYCLKDEAQPIGTEASEFMERTGKDLTQKLFGNVHLTDFENPLNFDSASSLFTYWSSYNLYDKSLEDKFKSAAVDHFKKHKIFKTVKRAIGIKAVKG